MTNVIVPYPSLVVSCPSGLACQIGQGRNLIIREYDHAKPVVLSYSAIERSESHSITLDTGCGLNIDTFVVLSILADLLFIFDK